MKIFRTSLSRRLVTYAVAALCGTYCLTLFLADKDALTIFTGVTNSLWVLCALHIWAEKGDGKRNVNITIPPGEVDRLTEHLIKERGDVE